MPKREERAITGSPTARSGDDLSCEHTFVTSHGSPHGRFQRAVKRRNVLLAEAAARELGRLSLMDALSLVVVYAASGSPKFEVAAVRWLARLATDGRDVGIAEIQLASAALAALKGPRAEKAERALRALL